MAKKSSVSSRRGKLVSVSAESIFSRPLTDQQRAVITRLAERQEAGDDSGIAFSDIPELTEEQLRTARRSPWVLVTARIDRDVHDWLRSSGEAPVARINTVLREAMARQA